MPTRQRIMLDDYPWDKIEETKRFLRSLYAEAPPARPGIIMHPPPLDIPRRPSPYAEGTPENEAWNLVENLRRRPVGIDDYVPTAGTGAGTCPFATAFGCRDEVLNNLHWVAPVIKNPADIRSLRKPKKTDGLLGSFLDQTRRHADHLDERIPIRIIDFQSPFTTVEQILGSDLFFMMPYDHPGELKTIMDITTDLCIEFISEQMQIAGPRCCPGLWPTFWFPKEAGVQMSDDNMVNVSPEIYEEFVVPFNNRISDAFGGLFLHSCVIKEANIPSIKKIRRLTGLNCDVSNSVSPHRLIQEFGQRSVVAPHVYMNSTTNFPSYAALMEWFAGAWTPGTRYFMHPCSVMYVPADAREIKFNLQEVQAAMRRFGVLYP